MPTLHDQFLAEVNAFISARNLSKSQFGELALRDRKFVFDMEGGRSPSLKTMDRVRQWMAANPPAGAEEGRAA